MNNSTLWNALTDVGMYALAREQPPPSIELQLAVSDGRIEIRIRTAAVSVYDVVLKGAKVLLEASGLRSISITPL